MSGTRLGPGVVAALLGVHAGLVAWSGLRHSPAVDEVAHLPAGISHWKFGRFDLYRVNPPLARMIAALPVVLAGPQADWSGYYDRPGGRPEFSVGRAFIKANGERAFGYFTMARWACIPFSLLGGYFCYRWARELFGTAAGWLALALWCFSPDVIGNAAMVMPDAPAAALGVAACYTFWRWLNAPTWRGAVTAGIALGLAELMKLTWIVLFALWPVLWLAWRGFPRKSIGVPHWRRETGQLATMLLLALYLLNLGYGFEGSFQRLASFQFVSRTLGGLENGAPGNRFADTWMRKLPVPVPSNYLLGIDQQKRDFEAGKWSYLRGQSSPRGWWYYYLYAAAIKVPLGTWLLVVLAGIVCFTGSGYRAGWRNELVLLAPLLVVFVLVSSQTGFSRHFRYVLPVFPFVFVWTSRLARSIDLRHRAVELLAALALLWSLGSSLWVYPHSESYFNELVGGPMGGHAHLIDSNIDWGQDLHYLKRWLDAHPEARPLHLAYFGLFDPLDAGVEYRLPPKGPVEPIDSNSGNLDDLGPQPGWYAVSVNLLRGYPYWAPDGRGGMVYLDKPYYGYFLRFRVTSRAGYSIWIYKISVDEANRVRRELQKTTRDYSRAACHSELSPFRLTPVSLRSAKHEFD